MRKQEKEQITLNGIDRHYSDDRIENGCSADDGNDIEVEPPNVEGDRLNLGLLLLLYTLQGIPLGLSMAIPMLLQKRGASYQTQAQFSFVYWPFTLKLLWAPIVDACYWDRFGRRKSWLVPVQYAIGAFMLAMSFFIEEWLGDTEHPADIKVLGIVFFLLTFLAATQDVATDGWSLVLLKRRNLGYASICNSVGHTIASIFGYVMLISLESAEFCNTWLRDEPHHEGIISLAGFLYFWGFVFLASTTLIALLKPEPLLEPSDHAESGHNHTSIMDTYKLGVRILWIPAMRLFTVILISVKFSWAYHEGVAFFKFLDAGVSNEKMIPLQAFTSLPIRFIVPCLIAKYTAGANPTGIYIRAIPYRTFFSLMGTLIVWATPFTLSADGAAPTYIYFVYLINDILYTSCAYCMHITITALFIKVSDPTVGGTYMTMLNTIDNFGGMWPYSLALWAVEYLTKRDCGPTGSADLLELAKNSTDIPPAVLNKHCPIQIDGYNVETVICMIFAFMWYRWGIPKVRYLQRIPLDDWRVKRKLRKPIDKGERLPVQLN